MGGLSGFLKVKVEGLNVLLMPVTSNVTIRLVGSSCRASCPVPSSSLNSVVFVLQKGQDAVVAITVIHDPGAKSQNTYVRQIVGLKWINEKVVIDLDTPFLSPEGRLGNIDSQDDLMVQVGEQWFVAVFDNWHGRYSENYKEKKDKALKAGYRLVDDPNLLCRYLIGEATVEELEVAATADRRTQLELALANVSSNLDVKTAELAEKTAKLDRVMFELTCEKNATKVLELENSDFRRALTKLGAKFQDLEGRYSALKSYVHASVHRMGIDGFLSWLCCPWGRIADLRDAIKKIQDSEPKRGE